MTKTFKLSSYRTPLHSRGFDLVIILTANWNSSNINPERERKRDARQLVVKKLRQLDRRHLCV